MTFERLPEEVLDIILRSCDMKDLCCLAGCNRFLYNATKASRWEIFTYRESMDFKMDPDRGQHVKHIKLVHRGQKIDRKSLSVYALGMGELLRVVNAEKLEKLEVTNSFPEDFCVERMTTTWINLSVLELHKVTLDDWSSFHHLKRLEELRVQNCSINDSSLEGMLKSYENLEGLFVFSCKQLTKNSLHIIGMKTKLVTLILANLTYFALNNVNDHVTRNCFRHLRSLPLLRELGLIGHPEIIKHSFDHLALMPALERVAFGVEVGGCDDYQEHLSKLNELALNDISFRRVQGDDVNVVRILSVLTAERRWSLNLLPYRIDLYRI